jgi:hypothetical protein
MTTAEIVRELPHRSERSLKRIARKQNLIVAWPNFANSPKTALPVCMRLCDSRTCPGTVILISRRNGKSSGNFVKSNGLSTVKTALSTTFCGNNSLKMLWKQQSKYVGVRQHSQIAELIHPLARICNQSYE